MPIHCINVVDWGDVPTWIGALFTGVAAWGVFRIANRDAAERKRIAANAARAKAHALLGNFSFATAFYDVIRVIEDEGRLPTLSIDDVRNLCFHYTGMRISAIDHNADLSSLHAGLAAKVFISASALARDQFSVMAMVQTPGLTREQLFSGLRAHLGKSRDVVIVTADALWALANDTSQPPPWSHLPRTAPK